MLGFKNENPVEFLNKLDIEKIHQASLEILEEVGMRIMHKRGRNLLEEAGCKVDHGAERVKFPPELVQWAIEKCPGSFQWKSRNPENDIIVDSSSIYIGNWRGSWYLDPETEKRRTGSTDDLAASVRLLDALPDIHWVFRPFSFLSDCSPEIEMLIVHITMLRNSDKVLGTVVFDDMHKWLIPIYEAAGLKTLASPSISAPLSLSEDQCQGILDYAAANHPIAVYGGAAKNAQGPATMAGCLALGNAQTLVGILLAQLTNPGIGVAYACGPDVLDMRYATASVASSETAMLSVASAQLARYHGIPSFAILGTDSKLLDSQAAYEKQLHTLLCAQAGTNIFLQVGIIDTEDIFSPVQTVIDHEICGMVGKVLEGIRVDEETMAIDLIKEIGPVPGNFLGTEHTRQHWRDETFLPTIGVRENYEAWVRGGSQGSVERAREKAIQLMKTHEPNPLPPEVEKEIAKILAAAEREKLQ
jgi:trimethylamine--corrinoid protein Co-methyltransferase